MIARIYNWLSRACRHEWETDKCVKVFDGKHDYPIAYEYHLRCTKCGNVKKVRL